MRLRFKVLITYTNEKGEEKTKNRNLTNRNRKINDIKKGSNVKVFFTWKSTTLSKDPSFPELCEIADDVSICVDSYKKQGFDVDDIPTGLTAKKMATQAQHGIIIEDFDCYLSL